jgi:hypothetical protein
MQEANIFVAAVSFVFGVLAWLQMPAVCGFMLSSTKAGAGNYIYSIWLGVLIAIVGLASGLPSLLKRGRGVLLITGAVLSAAFIVGAAAAHEEYDVACHGVFDFFEGSLGTVTE